MHAGGDFARAYISLESPKLETNRNLLYNDSIRLLFVFSDAQMRFSRRRGSGLTKRQKRNVGERASFDEGAANENAVDGLDHSPAGTETIIKH